MTVTDGKRSVTAYGMTPVTAENSPLTPDGVRARLSKMGNTLLSLPEEDIELTLDENINLPPSALNGLRREAAELFQIEGRSLEKLTYTPTDRSAWDKSSQLLTAQFMSESAFLDALDRVKHHVSEFDVIFLPHTASVESLRLAGGVYLPPVVFDGQTGSLVSELKKIREAGVLYALVGNIGQIAVARDLGFRIVGDFRLNVTNSESKRVLYEMGVEHLILSPELTLPKARDIGGGVITYGRIPLMITERCFIGENFGCEKCNKAALTDRKGEKFPMMREFEHRNIILNSVPTYMGDRIEELRSYRLRSYHMIFTIERGEEISSALSAHHKGAPQAKRY